MTALIEIVTSENFDDILPLIKSYQEFYAAPNIDEDNNRRFFSQFIHAQENSAERGLLYLLRYDKTAIGFFTLYFGYSSAKAEAVAILNDLYIVPAYRRRGFGKKMIEKARSVVKDKGLHRLQWLTAKSNHTAQQLYDSLGAAKSEWIFYSCDF